MKRRQPMKPRPRLPLPWLLLWSPLWACTNGQDQRIKATLAQPLCVLRWRDSFTVGKMMPVQYWEDSPRVTLLANGLGIYRRVLATAAASLGLIVLPLLGLLVRFRRFLLSQPVLSEPVSLHYQSGESQASGLSPTQEFVKKYSERALGASRYPTPRIGLKEALLLLHLRSISSEFRDDVK